jgi:hypothetical protein
LRDFLALADEAVDRLVAGFAADRFGGAGLPDFESRDVLRFAAGPAILVLIGDAPTLLKDLEIGSSLSSSII